MNISERPLDEETSQAIREYAAEAAQRLKIDLQSGAPPEEIVDAIDRYVFEQQKALYVSGTDPRDSTADDAENEETALTMASLWGEQIASRLGWQWCTVVFHDHDDAEVIAICSADRSVAIYPFQFVFSCLEDRTPVTILLAFKILVEGDRVPNLPGGGYVNVMDNVHHIVPRS